MTDYDIESAHKLARASIADYKAGHDISADELSLANAVIAACDALRQVERGTRRDTLEMAAKVCEDNQFISGGPGPLFCAGWNAAVEHTAKAILAISSTANELSTTQELADGIRHLSESEQGAMDRALMASVKIVDDGYVRVPREPTKAMLEAAVKSRHGDATYRCVSKDGCYALEDEAAEDYRAMIQAAEEE